MILNACVVQDHMVDENHCKVCQIETDCRHKGAPTTKERLESYANDPAPILNSDFWDCDCDNKFIHRTSVEKCPLCGALQEDMPSSRQNEIDEGTHFADCIFFERDEAAFNEHHEYMKHQAAENPSPYMDSPEPDRPCYNFCKHFGQHNGYPGETLLCCEHPQNKHIIDCDSIFDGVEDYSERMRILDAIC